PTTSTLFPYTTLFRSKEVHSGGEVVPGFVPLERVHHSTQPESRAVTSGTVPSDVQPRIEETSVRIAGVTKVVCREVAAKPVSNLDRKSTRLNSSHQII